MMIQLQENELQQVLQLVSHKHLPSDLPDQDSLKFNFDKTYLKQPEQELVQNLLEHHIFYLDDTKEVKMDSHSHLVFSAMANADFFLTMFPISDSAQTESASFYAYNETLIYAKKYNDLYQIYWLPHIPMVIGGITSFLSKAYKHQFPVEICGILQGTENPDFQLLLQEIPSDKIDIIHAATQWFSYQYSNNLKGKNKNA